MNRYRILIVVLAAALFAADVVSAAKPDFSGTWERYPDPYAVFTENAFAKDPPAPDGGPTLKQPYAREYKKFIQRKAEASRQGKPLADASTRCLPEGVPTIMGAIYPIEILQTPQQIVVLAEFLTQTRRIYLNEKMPAFEDISPGYNGYSVGHWEGDTLVVQTIGVREDVRFYAIPHSEQMKVTERFRLTGPNSLENQVTIDDPAFLAKPYKFTFGYRRNSEYRIMEYICDNNRKRFDADGNVSLEVSPE
jgi:hypothetical protein